MSDKEEVYSRRTDNLVVTAPNNALEALDSLYAILNHVLIAKMAIHMQIRDNLYRYLKAEILRMQAELNAKQSEPAASINLQHLDPSMSRDDSNGRGGTL